ncbi:MAG: hypothetical protein ACRD3Y_04285 [Bryobacteraceae bacterium]
MTKAETIRAAADAYVADEHATWKRSEALRDAVAKAIGAEEYTPDYYARANIAIERARLRAAKKATMETRRQRAKLLKTESQGLFSRLAKKTKNAA